MPLWEGRFSRNPGAEVRRFGDSISFDLRLALADVQASIVYACALVGAGILTESECSQLVHALEQIRGELAEGRLEARPDDEDVHAAVESRLQELVGQLAGKLPTGRSRNDQVATDLRLYLLKEINKLRSALGGLQGTLIEKAHEHLDVIMPGYTHGRQAQPVLFSHWLLSHFWRLERDQRRLGDCSRRTAELPLGAGALAGNPFGVDREAMARDLGFTVAENSLDAVADRDFVAEFLFCAALLQVHLSQLAEDLIVWGSFEFGFVEVDEHYCTGSSLMPQKKNPDTLELVRAKSGRILGHLTGFLVVLKGLVSGYSKDLQEDKEPLFDTLDTLEVEIPVVAGILETLAVNTERMSAALDARLLATDLADYLVRMGIPFRQAHHLVGRAVRRAEELGVSLSALDLAEYRAISTNFGADLYTVFDFRKSVNARDVRGGTALRAVEEQLAYASVALATRRSPDYREL